MLPSIAAGDFVFTRRLFLNLHIGDCVVVNHEQYGCIIKRIDQICPKKGFWLKGDNAASIPSENMGWIQKKEIIAKTMGYIRSRKSNKRQTDSTVLKIIP